MDIPWLFRVEWFNLVAAAGFVQVLRCGRVKLKATGRDARGDIDQWILNDWCYVAK